MVEPQVILDLLLKYEQETSLVNKKLAYKAIDLSLESREITLIIFSCLTSNKGREEIIIDFFKTSFFDGGAKEMSRSFKRAVQISKELEDFGLVVNVFPILVDTEPRRTWGWRVPQDEMTIACEIMVEQAYESLLLPKNWQPKLWSELEAQYNGEWTSERAIEWARSSGKHSICVSQQERHLAKFTDKYHFPLGLQETAVRQLGSYAFEGVVFESLFPSAILLQSEYPWSEKDALYQWLRHKKQELVIIHPFVR